MGIGQKRMNFSIELIQKVWSFGDKSIQNHIIFLLLSSHKLPCFRPFSSLILYLRNVSLFRTFVITSKIRVLSWSIDRQVRFSNIFHIDPVCRVSFCGMKIISFIFMRLGRLLIGWPTSHSHLLGRWLNLTCCNCVGTPNHILTCHIYSLDLLAFELSGNLFILFDNKVLQLFSHSGHLIN